MASEMEGFIMKEIKCAHCGEIVHIDNSDYEKILILLEKRVAEKEMIITEVNYSATSNRASCFNENC